MASKDETKVDYEFIKQGWLFHSKRNPQREAQKQLEHFFRLSSSPQSRVVFAINPGLHFIRQEAEKYVNQVYCLYLPGWGYELLEQPGSEDFLFTSEAELIDWFNHLHPSLLLLKPLFFYHPMVLQIDYPLTQRLQLAIHQSLREKQQELYTRGFFSYKYKKNILRHLRSGLLGPNHHQENFQLNNPHSNKPNLLLVSGPTLQTYQSFLTEQAQEWFIIALPSTLAFLDAIHVKPDVVISTDPGYWAGLHLRYLNWIVHPSEIKVWMGLFSESGSSIASNLKTHPTQVRLFTQTTMIERLICTLVPEMPRLPEVHEAATVSATAIELLIQYTDQPTLVLGLDLGETESMAHVHPHPFDSFFHAQSSRTNRFETNHWKKLSQNHSSLAYYRKWFTKQAQTWKSQVWFGSLNQFQIPNQTLDVTHAKEHLSTIPQRIPEMRPPLRTNPGLELEFLRSRMKTLIDHPFQGIHRSESKEILDLLLQLDFFGLKAFLEGWPNSPSLEIPWNILKSFNQEMTASRLEP